LFTVVKIEHKGTYLAACDRRSSPDDVWPSLQLFRAENEK